jgi:gluconokinase
VEEVRASGGFVHSPLWLGIMASALRREIHVPAWGETSSLGAAAWALIGAGELNSLEEFGPLSPLEKSCQPTEADAAVYDQLYAIYTQVYQASLEAFNAIAQFQEDLNP